jgi:hypothetical protein
VGGVLVSGEGVEEEEAERRNEEGKAELRRADEERDSSLRRAIVVSDMLPLEERVSEHRKRDVLDAIEEATVRSRNPDRYKRLRLANIDYSKSRLQGCFNVMLRQQSILPLLQFLRLFNQASGTLQLALANLLDVNLIRSLKSLLQYQHRPARR